MVTGTLGRKLALIEIRFPSDSGHVGARRRVEWEHGLCGSSRKRFGASISDLRLHSSITKNKNRVLTYGPGGVGIKNGVNELCILFLCINRYFLPIVSKRAYIGT